MTVATLTGTYRISHQIFPILLFIVEKFQANCGLISLLFALTVFSVPVLGSGLCSGSLHPWEAG